MSDVIRMECMSQCRKSAVDAQAEQISVKRDAEEQADRSVTDRAKKRLLELLDALDPTREGISERDLQNKLSKPQRRVMGESLADLYKGGFIDRREGIGGSEIYSLHVG